MRRSSQGYLRWCGWLSRKEVDRTSMRQGSDGVCQSARQAAAELTVGTYWYRSIVPRLRQFGKKVAHTRLPNVGFRSWSRFLAVSPQVTWVINPTVGCLYFSPGLQLPPQPLRKLLPILLLGEQRHNGCEDCYRTASRLRFEPGTFCAWVQHANHSATEPPCLVLSKNMMWQNSCR